jgi:hypothetical protein
LRNAVGIKKEIVVAGVLDKIEIWAKEIYDRNLNALWDGDMTKMTEEAFALLSTEKSGVEQKVEQEKVLEKMFSKVPL